MFEVTLKDLRSAMACINGYNKVVCALKGVEFDSSRETYIRFAHKEPISILSIIETNGLYDAIWSLRCVKGHDRDIRLYAVWCARQVEHLSDDPRVKACIDVAERFANGEATLKELAAARDAARAAARDAAWAAASDAASDAARAAARAAAWASASAAQKQMLIDMCNGNAPWQK